MADKVLLITVILASIAAFHLSDVLAQKQDASDISQSELLQNIRGKAVEEDELRRDINEAINLAAHETVMYHQNDMHNKSSISELARGSLQSRLFHAVYNDLLIHQYDSISELRNSGGPHVNQELCLQQLAHLNHRYDLQLHQKYHSQDINLAQLLNTFGRPSPDFYLGDGFWPGAYEECLRLQVETVQGNVPTRYCVAHTQLKSWTHQSSPLDKLTAMKSGVCLPRSCDSVRYKNKYKLILRLLESNMRDIDRNETEMVDLYCLPDSQSPDYSWWRQPGTAISLGIASIWIMMLTYVTFMKDPNSTIYKSLSIQHNLKQLFKTTESHDVVTENKASAEVDDSSMNKSAAINLDILDGIKVITLLYIIIGHVIMTIPHNMSNFLESARNNSPTTKLTNMAPAFAVNGFFGITGLLTAYHMLRQNTSFSFMKNPIKFTAYAMHRYVRIMPVYAVSVAYSKYVAKFIGSGPFWDYGTTALGHRRVCEEESWLWTLLFGANFKSPLRHCNSTAWYLANDFYFFLITPIFLSVIRSRPTIGKILMIIVIATSYYSSIKSGLNSDLDDYRPTARYQPHGFRHHITNLHVSYTRPYYRIPAYLVGLLAGYFLFVLETRRIKSRTDVKNQVNDKTSDSKESTSYTPDWPTALSKCAPFVCALFIILCATTPITSAIRPIAKEAAKYKVSIAVPTFNLLFSLAITTYTLVSSTGHGFKALNRFLSRPFWKPLSRLGLCALLVNVEFIIYISEARSRTLHKDELAHISLNIISIIGTYVMSVVLYVLVEAPIRGSLTNLFKSFTNKTDRQLKKNN